MDQLLGIFFSFVVSLLDIKECPPPLVKYDYTYELPEGISSDKNLTLKRNGMISVSDSFGNSAYISPFNDLLEEKQEAIIDFNKIAEMYKSNNFFVDGEFVNYKIYKAKFENTGPYDPYDVILSVDMDGFFVSIVEFLEGPPQTHSVFEDKALKAAQNFARGESYEVKNRNCGYRSFWDRIPRWSK